KNQFPVNIFQILHLSMITERQTNRFKQSKLPHIFNKIIRKRIIYLSTNQNYIRASLNITYQKPLNKKKKRENLQAFQTTKKFNNSRYLTKWQTIFIPNYTSSQ